jgi:hypothetical protein
MKAYPGQVWFLPPEMEEGGDGKRRRHLLLTNCDDETVGVCAFASTKLTEARFGAAFLSIDPASSLDPRTGFSKPTCIYLSRLIVAASDDLLELMGRLVHEFPAARAHLAVALGLGTGTSNGWENTASGWRGRVVHLSARRRELIGFEFGIILTENRYSACCRYQIIVPIADHQETAPEAGDVILTQKPWFRQIGADVTEVIIAVREVHSIFHPIDVDRWTGAVIDDGTLGEIETALRRLFEL